ncbi:MAG: hypothetical protein L6Q99_14185 [Planctomycetes bacterium]|nr:hypothetical protein [Planctomycetota bacterium]
MRPVPALAAACAIAFACRPLDPFPDGALRASFRLDIDLSELFVAKSIRWESQELLLRLDEPHDAAELFVLTRGVVPARHDRAAPALQAIAEGRRYLVGFSPAIEVDPDGLLGSPVPRTPPLDDPRLEEFLERWQVCGARVFREADGRLAYAQHLRFTGLSAALEWLNVRVSEHAQRRRAEHGDADGALSASPSPSRDDWVTSDHGAIVVYVQDETSFLLDALDPARSDDDDPTRESLARNVCSVVTEAHARRIELRGSGDLALELVVADRTDERSVVDAAVSRAFADELEANGLGLPVLDGAALLEAFRR